MSTLQRAFTALGLLAATSPALAQVPAGGEFRVHEAASGSQYTYGRAVARRANGDFVVVWRDDQGVMARRFDALANPLGASIVVATSSSAEANDVAIDAGGNFAVTWDQFGGNPPQRDVYVRRYDAAANARGPAFRANSYTTQTQAHATVAIDGRGNLAVFWGSFAQDGDSWGIYGQLYDAAGTPRGAEFRVNSATIGPQLDPFAAMSPDGRFLVTWGDGRIWGRLFAADGTSSGADFLISATTSGNFKPQAAADDEGRFTVAWSWQGGPGGLDVRARRLSAAGQPLTAEIPVNVFTTGNQAIPTVSSDGEGNFVVAWFGGTDPNDSSLGARRFTSAGVARSGDFAPNTYTTGSQGAPTVSSDAVGNFVVAWTDDGHGAGDLDVFGQRFGGLHPVGLAVDAAAGSGSDGNGVLDPGETTTVAPSWRNVNGAAQAFTGALSDMRGPAGATYAITDAAASYGTVANGATADCGTACFAVSVSAPATRPAAHWDVDAREGIAPDVQGQVKRWTLHVGGSFTDVPRSSPFYRFVETLTHHGVTSGCTGGAFCGTSPTLREQMAVFVLLSKEGPTFLPVPCGTPAFADVPASSVYCRWIEELARRGVVGGCGGGNFCPGSSVSRAQMAVFLLATKEDPGYAPPACGTPLFGDVPAGSPFCPWIEELARRGVTGGCGGGNYCPDAPVTREQTAVLVSATFGLTLYGP